MRTSDSLYWVGLAGVLLYLYSRRGGFDYLAPGSVPGLPWTMTNLPFDPNYVPSPPARSIPIANQTIQPAYQGGSMTPSTLRTQILR
jgi:hypothetical protein